MSIQNLWLQNRLSLLANQKSAQAVREKLDHIAKESLVKVQDFVRQDVAPLRSPKVKELVDLAKS